MSGASKLISPVSPLLLILGLGLSFDDVHERIDAIIKYTRVSTKAQEKGTSIEDQDEKISEEERFDVEHVVRIGYRWESGKTMRRDTINQIIQEVEGSDRTYCLMLRDIDRLTRADPLEAAAFLWKMKREGVILYVDGQGYFDMVDPTQQLMLFLEVVQARREYDNITKGRESGQRKKLEKNEWPGRPSYGFTKTDGDELEIIEEQKPIILRIVDIVLNGDERAEIPPGNMKRAHRQVEKEYDSDLTPSYHQVRSLLRDPKYTGRLIHKGEKVGECPTIIPQTKFDDLQDVLGERTHTRDKNDLDHGIIKLVDRFGVDSALDKIGDVIKGKCPKCGGDVRPWGSDTVHGHQVKKYICEHNPSLRQSDDGDDDEEADRISDENNGKDKKDNKHEHGGETEQPTCGFEGPLMSANLIEKWESSVPLSCPACQHPLNDKGWKITHTQIGGIEQYCDHCGLKTTLTVSDNRFKRARDIPETFSLFKNDSEEDSPDEQDDQNEQAETHTQGQSRLLNDFT
ncbi:recombinase family protein [Halorubrum vacuolatum]|uniref:recombinase family protein n=1 Tax=Halorubrum vacuolatum TaxID=63740 RepID=UPI001C5319A9|nr:recombinase family protein [Halorubrum vacuolatum]